MNEAAVGAAIAESGVAREELFITTKLWVQDAGYESARKAIRTSLEIWDWTTWISTSSTSLWATTSVPTEQWKRLMRKVF